MNDMECLLFVETAIENGSDVNEAIQDMRMIDNMLHMERLHIVSFGFVRKTSAGHYRRGTTLANALESIIDSRSRGAEM